MVARLKSLQSDIESANAAIVFKCFVFALSMLACVSGPAVAQSIRTDGNALIVDGAPPLAFEAAGYQFAESPQPTLGAIKAFLDTRPYITTLRIEGHVASGDDRLVISVARALVTARTLVAMGVDCKRLVAAGFGDTKPIAAGDDSANSRISFSMAALRGNAIGGAPLNGNGVDPEPVCTQ
jgi:OmpA-OmpF porin, OOP family